MLPPTYHPERDAAPIVPWAHTGAMEPRMRRHPLTNAAVRKRIVGL